MKTILRFHLLSALLLIGVVYVTAQESPLKRVKTDHVIHHEATKRLSFTAPLRARERTTLSFSVPARMVKRHVQIGEQVKKGQVLAELNSETYDHALNAAEAEVLRLNIQKQQAEKDLKRVSELFESHAATREELEMLETRLNALASGIQAALAQKAEAAHLLDETKLKAPFNATIAEVLLEEGEFASPGRPVCLLTGTELEMEIRVPESTLSGIQADDPVEISFPLLKRSNVAGRIDRIGSASFSANLLFPVIINMEPSSGLRPGVTAKAAIQFKAQATLIVPVSAIINPSNRQPELLAVIDHRIKVIPIQINSISGTQVAISGDIKPGTEIVIAGHSGLLEGDRVEVVQ